MSNIDQFVDAAREGDYDVVSSLLSEGIDINQKNSFGNTALMNASGRNDEKVVSLLTECPKAVSPLKFDLFQKRKREKEREKEILYNENN